MSDLKRFLGEHLGGAAAAPNPPLGGHLARNELVSFSDRIRNEFGARLALMTAIDGGNKEFRYSLILAFHVTGEPEYVITETPLPADRPTFPTLTGVFANAAWPERELRDLFGIQPLEHPDPRPLVWKGGWQSGIHPMRRDVRPDRSIPVERVLLPTLPVRGEGVFEIPVGPIHAGIIEPGHFRFQAIGDTMLTIDAQLFFCHRGLEKLAEGRTADDVLLLAERQCGTCSVSNALSFVIAVERAAGVEPPPRSALLRVIVSELERLYNHANDVSAIAAGVGLAFVSQQGLRIKEEIQRICAGFFGHRFLRNLLIPGGVRFDPPANQLDALLERLRPLVAELDSIAIGAFDNGIFVDRLETTGVLSLENAVALGGVGPAVRASGVAADTRADHPDTGYRSLTPITPPTRPEGDVMARYRMRLDELRPSLALIEEAVRKLPAGPVRTSLPKIQPGACGLGSSESARGENLQFVVFGADQKLMRYAVRSASYLNWPLIPTTVRGNIVPDFPLINKSFELCYADVDR